MLGTMTFSPDRDPRRIGFAALGFAGVYSVLIFINESTTVRLTFGAVFTAGTVALAAFMPLPDWQERDERKRVAAWAMVAEAAIFAAVITVIRLATGHA
jgi:predicted membrane protein